MSKKKFNPMTMMELQEIMGNKIRAIDTAEPGVERQIAIEDARAIAHAATQFINGNRFILDAEKLEAQVGVLKHSKAYALIGE